MTSTSLPHPQDFYFTHSKNVSAQTEQRSSREGVEYLVHTIPISKVSQNGAKQCAQALDINLSFHSIAVSKSKDQPVIANLFKCKFDNE